MQEYQPYKNENEESKEQHNEEQEHIDEECISQEICDISKYKNRNVINSKYIFERKIGKGSFGCIHQGLNIMTQEKVAIKYEATTCEQPTLLWESKVLNHLSGIPGVVKLRYFGTESNKNIIVMDLFSHTLGQEVENLKKEYKIGIKNESESESQSESEGEKKSENSSECDRHSNDDNDSDENTECQIKNYKYYMKNILKYMITMFEIIERIHEKSVIHRDIKPENFMISISKTKEGDVIKKLNIIDFGLSRIYIKENKHIPNKENSSIVGTLRYISTHIHEGNVYSRRDDIISILYVIIYLLKGSLPWCGLRVKPGDKKTKAEFVCEVKKTTPICNLCEGLPGIFERMLTYAYKIEFEEKPDYIYLKRLCKQGLSAYE
jgi:casein kinase 1